MIRRTLMTIAFLILTGMNGTSLVYCASHGEWLLALMNGLALAISFTVLSHEIQRPQV